MKDKLGFTITGATGTNSAGLDAFQAAQDDFKCLTGDPVAHVERALQHCPEMTMAWVLKAYLYLLGTEPQGTAIARACCEAAIGLPANDREQRHLKAVTLLAHGHWHKAGRVLEDISIAYPLDLIALQAGHQVDYFTGDARMLRDRIARALPFWQSGMHGRHAVLGMYAFGLEETGDYSAAEKHGRASVELEPSDSWAWHAVAHVKEMTHQSLAGIEWLKPNSGQWANGSFLATHNWWHLALFHLELDQIDEVLALYDGAIDAAGSSLILDMIDASAMLWRLHLRGIDVGKRWQGVAERWHSAGVPGFYAFNDMHAMIAYVGSGGRISEQQAILQAQRQAMEANDDNAFFTREVGHAAALAMQAFGEGDFDRCAGLLRNIRSRANRFGGSHAQRDLIDLTLLEAARRGSQPALARALEIERECLRPRKMPAAALLRAA